MDLLDWLGQWYVANCNKDWEHTYGVSIQTLDNPRWSITIDLIDTPLQGKHLTEVFIENSEDDWFRISSNGEQFKGYGDGSKLKVLIEKFRTFTQPGGTP